MSVESMRPRIDEALFRGNKVEAIKIYREEAGCQLMEAKNAVEAIEKELRKAKPERFRRQSSASGAIGLRLVAIAIALAVLAYVLLK